MANASLSTGVNSRGELVPSHGASRRRLGDNTIPYHTIPYYIYLVYKIIIKLNFFQVEKGNTGFFPTHITGVIAHGQDLKMCFIDQLKWPADANVTINILVTVLKFIKDKVVVYSIV